MPQSVPQFQIALILYIYIYIFKKKICGSQLAVFNVQLFYVLLF